MRVPWEGRSGSYTTKVDSFLAMNRDLCDSTNRLRAQMTKPDCFGISADFDLVIERVKSPDVSVHLQYCLLLVFLAQERRNY